MNKREALIRLVAGIEAGDSLGAQATMAHALNLYELILEETRGPTEIDHIGEYVNGEISE